MFRVGGGLLFLALSACTQVQVEHQSDSFNRASASTIAEQTLLNAVRSSLDLPMSFTKLQKFTAGSVAKGSLLPIAPGATSPRFLDWGPTVSWSGGVEAIEYADVNNSGALAKLNEDVSYGTFERYISQGLDSRLVDTILVEHAEIDAAFMSALLMNAKKKCSRQGEQDDFTCGELRSIGDICPLFDLKGTYGLPGGRAVFVLRNRAQTKCGFLEYQALLNVLRLAGMWTDLAREKTLVFGKTEEGKRVVVPKQVPYMVLRFDEPDMQRAYNDLDKKLFGKKRDGKIERDAKQKPIFAYTFRSPKSLLTYLGELIALQNHGDGKFVPEVLKASGDRLAIFRVIRGQGLSTPAALAIRGPDGQMYSVPRPDYGSERRDQSLRVLAIAGELVNGAISEKDFPVPASITVRAVQ